MWVDMTREKPAQFILIALGVILIVIKWFVYRPVAENPLGERSYYEFLIGAVLILIGILLPYIWGRRSN